MRVSERSLEASEDPVVVCRALSVDYRTATGVSPALVEVDATFARGRLSVIAGPSGSGKSTLLRVLAGLHRPERGEVLVDGVRITALPPGPCRRLRRRVFGMVLQNPIDNLLDYLTAREQVELAARLRGAGPAADDDLLDAVGLAHKASCLPVELSGGEQQRVAFAAAAVGDPTVLLADEPTAQLDATSGAELIGTMGALVERGVTLVVSSHDPDVIAAADDVLALHDGQVVAR